MNAYLRKLGLASACLALPLALSAGCSEETTSTPDPNGDAGNVGDGGPLEPFKAQIRRTSLGVPHIKADSLGGVGYGYGYAFSEDNLCLLEEEILTVRGERAKHFGEAPYDLGNTKSRSNVDSDAVYKMLMTPEVITRSRAALDEEMQSMVRGYAAGVSRYVRELKAGQHAGRHITCRNEAWAREITEEDLYRRYYKLSLLASSATFIDGIAAAQPIAASIAPPPATKSFGAKEIKEATESVAQGLTTVAPALMAYRNGELGSNMYAFGSDVTGGGGIQFGNPHFPWFGGERLYQVHLTVPGKLDVQGGSLYGAPIVLIGFTDTFAWSHTVSTAFRFTPYQLTLKEGDQLTYIQDGAEKKITPIDLTVEVKGEATARTVRLYRSEYGPMVYLGNPLAEWNLKQAFTFRDANAENFRLIRQFARWNMAKSLEEFKTIHAEEVATPWVNTTAADKEGNAYYADLTVVPNVPDALAFSCAVNSLFAGAFAAAQPGLPLLDGSKKACDWVVDPAASQPGAFAAKDLPRVERKDWVVNCNDSYWLTNTKTPVTGYAKIIGREAYPQSLRSRLCHKQVLDRVAGTDGLPGAGFTAENVKAMVLGSRVFSAEIYKPTITAAVCAAPSPIILTEDAITVPPTAVTATIDATAACAALAAWDNRNNPDSRGSLLWDEMWLRIEKLIARVGFEYGVPFDPADPINPPRGITATPALVQAFAAAIHAVQTAGFQVDTPRSAISYREGKGGPGDRIPVPGGLQRTGNFTIAQTASPVLKPGTGYGPMLYGNSYIQVVAFTPTGVDASTFVTYSLSTDTASEHYDDYTRRYSTKEWLKAAFTEADVAADTKSTVELQQ